MTFFKKLASKTPVKSDLEIPLLSSHPKEKELAIKTIPPKVEALGFDDKFKGLNQDQIDFLQGILDNCLTTIKNLELSHRLIVRLTEAKPELNERMKLHHQEEKLEVILEELIGYQQSLQRCEKVHFQKNLNLYNTIFQGLIEKCFCANESLSATRKLSETPEPEFNTIRAEVKKEVDKELNAFIEEIKTKGEKYLLEDFLKEEGETLPPLPQAVFGYKDRY
ncbi:MAG TPA: hypothetical protein VD770_03200 [Coxiellaceae bacterium]|nr:hypothetical protein [Coxiellaceae bacterium]